MCIKNIYLLHMLSYCLDVNNTSGYHNPRSCLFIYSHKDAAEEDNELILI